MLLIKPEVLTVQFTETCNLRCRYCHVPKNQEEQVFGSVDETTKYFDNVLERIGNEYTHLAFWGGEPTINLPCFTEFLTEETYSKYFPKLQTIGFSTNLSGRGATDSILNLKKKVLSFKADSLLKSHFLDKKFFVQVSIDGPKFIHDYQRPPSTLEQVVINSLALRNNGIGVSLKPTTDIAGIRKIMRSKNSYESYCAHVNYIQEVLETPYVLSMAGPGEYTQEDGRIYAEFCKMETLRGNETFAGSSLRGAIQVSEYVQSPVHQGYCCAGRTYNLHLDGKGELHHCQDTFSHKKDEVDNISYINLNDDLAMARRDYTIPFGILSSNIAIHNMYLAIVELLALSDQLSPIYKVSKEYREILVNVLVQSRFCSSGNLYKTGEMVVGSEGFVKLFGNGALELAIDAQKEQMFKNSTLGGPNG